LTNIQSGIVYGYAGLVEGIVERLRAELDEAMPAPVIVTGGLATLIADVPRCIQHVEPNLTLDGVRLCFERTCL
jgi:type III pantothenate kinase